MLADAAPQVKEGLSFNAVAKGDPRAELGNDTQYDMLALRQTLDLTENQNLTLEYGIARIDGNGSQSAGDNGLTGGHSGVEINKGRANANKVLAAALQGLPVTLCSIAGGSKDNAIPRASEAVVVSDADDFAALFAANAAKAALPETEQHAEVEA